MSKTQKAAATAPSTATSYREAYATLSRIAAELESGEADLDHVLPLLQEAQVAYAQCQERIEAVRSVLAGGALAAAAAAVSEADTANH